MHGGDPVDELLSRDVAGVERRLAEVLFGCGDRGEQLRARDAHVDGTVAVCVLGCVRGGEECRWRDVSLQFDSGGFGQRGRVVAVDVRDRGAGGGREGGALGVRADEDLVWEDN